MKIIALLLIILFSASQSLYALPTWPTDFLTTPPGPLVGTPDDSDGGTGNVGEFISATRIFSTKITLTSNAASNVTSIDLTAGDWDVYGEVDFVFDTTTSYTNLSAGISPGVSAGDPKHAFVLSAPATVPIGSINAPTVYTRVTVPASTTTTVYLVAKCVFTVSSLQAYGTISARRAR